MDCVAIECPEGQMPQAVQSGQCCPTTCIPIKPDCSAVSCPLCQDGEVPETPPGECCPVCTRPDCAAVLCLAVEECEGKIVTLPGECCPKCLPILDCSTVFCALPPCKEGGVIETPPGQCCPVCIRPDCSAVLCLALTEEDCEEGETLVTPPGECCARCQPKLKLDCSTVLCAKRLCREGQSSQVPEGQCCPVCVNNGKHIIQLLYLYCKLTFLHMHSLTQSVLSEVKCSVNVLLLALKRVILIPTISASLCVCKDAPALLDRSLTLSTIDVWNLTSAQQ